MTHRWDVAPCPVTGPVAAALLREYFDELVRTYHGRPARPDEVDPAMRDSPSDGLTPPSGLFLVGRALDGAGPRGNGSGARRDAVPGGEPAVCVGLRLLRPGFGKLTRMYVRRDRRGTGGAHRVIAELERRARDLGVHTVQLDTRHDRVAARRLYARLGYLEVGPLWTDPYAEHWFEKRLDQRTGSADGRA